jgi:hypothetical protein
MQSFDLIQITSLNNVSSTLNIKAGYKFMTLYQLVIYNDLTTNHLKTKHLSCTYRFQLRAHNQGYSRLKANIDIKMKNVIK